MIIVLDTTVVVSAFLYGGVPAKLWDVAESGAISLVTSDALVSELKRTFAKPKFTDRLSRTKTTPEELAVRFLAVASLVVAAQVPRVVPADSADDAVLACALGAKADAIVSGDDHLLALRTFEGIAILTPAQALARVRPA